MNTNFLHKLIVDDNLKKLQIFHKIMSFIKSQSIEQIQVLRFSSIERVRAAFFF